jgi:hypothetical protein
LLRNRNGDEKLTALRLRAGATSEERANKKRNLMTLVTVKLSMKELALLTTLASDQLFRREFIDRRLPGCKIDGAELALGKKLVERLRLTADRAGSIALPRRNRATA